MSSLADFNFIREIHRGAAVVVIQRHSSKAAQHIQPSYGRRRLLDARQLRCNRRSHLLVQLGSPVYGFLLGVQHPFLQLLYLLGNVPLGIGQGLLADIMRRHLILEGIGNLDVIAEHPVIPDAQRPDAGGILFPFLYLRQDAPDILRKMPSLIQLLIVPLPDDTAFFQRNITVRIDGRADEPGHILQGVYVLFNFPQQGALHLTQQLLNGRQTGRSSPQGDHILHWRIAVHHPGHQPFQVIHAIQGRHQLTDENTVPGQLGHGIQPPVNGIDR